MSSLADDVLVSAADARLAPLLSSSSPAWLFAPDGSRVVWANAAGVVFFGATSLASLTKRRLQPGAPVVRQIESLARSLPEAAEPKLALLRFAVGLHSRAVSCLCRRFRLDPFGSVLLAVGAEPREVPGDLVDALRGTIETLVPEEPVAILAEGGALRWASAAWRESIGPVLAAQRRVLPEMTREAHHGGRVTMVLSDFRVTVVRLALEGEPAYMALAAFTGAENAYSADAGPPDAPPLEGARHLVATEDAEHESAPAFNPADEPDEPEQHGRRNPAAADVSSPVESPVIAPVGAASGPEEGSAPDRSRPEPVPSDGFDGPAPTAAPDIGDRVPGIAAPPRPAGPPDWISAAELPRKALRFAWRMDGGLRFSAVGPELEEALGPDGAAIQGLTWDETASRYGLDPDGEIARALSHHETWTAARVWWPVRGGGSVPVDLAALPVFDANQQFQGYRGFGICRLDQAIRARIPANEPDST
ncbi:MAG: hypothetical protein M3145_06810, partial [Pseudomonadota bacterium]|nr:hypothetical protein [Pseudomonadota bacterium]